MAIHVAPAEDADMDRIFEICSLAFARNEPMWDALYPNHWTEKGRKAGAERMRATMKTDRNTIFVKAVDPATGEIMGMINWNFFENGTFPESTETSAHYFDTLEDKQYHDKMVLKFLSWRNAALQRSGGNLSGINILVIDPAYQRRGVGDALVKWGLEKADKLGHEAVVESSRFGKGLYLKNGFVFQEDARVEVPEFPDRPVPEFAWLVRPKQ